MRFKNPTPEEIEIEEAMDAHIDSMKHEHLVFRTAAVLYLVGFPLFLFGSGWFERVGIAMVLTGLFAFLYHFIVHLQSEKKRRYAAELLQPYLKRKSEPLVRDLREKFADDPTIRFVHNDDGSVIVVRKGEDSNM